MNTSYILNIDLQVFFIMVKVLGEFESLVIEGEHSLEKGQHLKKITRPAKQTNKPTETYQTS